MYDAGEMKVRLVAYGTRGDVQPFVCLGRALADRGHDVEIIAPRNGETMARSAGLPFRALPIDAQAIFGTEQAGRMLSTGRASEFLHWAREEEKTHTVDVRRTLLATTESADLIVCSTLIEAWCWAIAKAHETALVSLHLFPHASSLQEPRTGRDDLAAFCRELGLVQPQPDEGRIASLLGYSQTLCPAPRDRPVSVHPAGFLSPWPELRARLGEIGIPPELEQWLRAGPPPVFIGFGSMPVLGEELMTHTVQAALADVGVRGIVAGGWSELGPADSDTLFVIAGEVDHQSLFPRCAAAVHHGGAGTTAAAAAAGIPALVCALFGDQLFWGERCRALGIGDTFSFAELDARRLSAGLRAVLTPGVAARAREVGRQMAAEDGIGAAVEHVERLDLERRRVAPRTRESERLDSGIIE